MRIVLINSRYPAARGVAYGTLRPEHVLNVVARNMSAFPDHPSHFVDWLRTRADFKHLPISVLREVFAPRRVFGDYLESLLFEHSAPVSPRAPSAIEIIRDEAVDVVPADGGLTVALKSGRTLHCDRAVLATGNLPPLSLACFDAIRDHPAYCADPWQEWHRHLPDPQDDILMIGTSLSMIDAVLTLTDLHWPGRMIAISRQGLLPLSHFQSPRDPALAMGEPHTLGLGRLVKWIETQCQALRTEGLNPAIVVDKLRPFTQQIWRALTIEEKNEFCRHYRTRWGVARHRIAPEIAERIENVRKTGRLEVLSGEIRDAHSDGPRIRVTIDRGPGQPVRTITTGILINCTGPRERFSDASEPLYRNLFQRGLVSPDEIDLGLQVAPDFAVIDRDGKPSSLLYAFGPLIRGTLWETTAVPELRSQAYQVAQTLLDDHAEGDPDWRPATPADLLEYQI